MEDSNAEQPENVDIVTLGLAKVSFFAILVFRNPYKIKETSIEKEISLFQFVYFINVKQLVNVWKEY